MATWMFILGAILGGAVGAAIAYLFVDRRARCANVAMQTDLALAQQRATEATAALDAQRQSVDDLRRDISGVQQERASLEAQLSSERRLVVEAREAIQSVQSQNVEITRQFNELKQNHAATLAQLDAEKKALAEQQEHFRQANARMSEAFAQLSQDALTKNSQSFFELATQTFKTLQTESTGALDQKKAEIAQILQPMQVVLDQYKEKLDCIEKARGDAYTNISSQLAAVAATQQNLSKETTQLVTALRKPQGRGRWGELTLKRLFEMAGMADRVIFNEQVSINTEDGRLRPDCIVTLPEDRQVIVDSKCVIDAFLDGSACSDDVSRLECMARHARQVRSRVGELSLKSYWEQFEKSTDYVVLFLPGEAFLYAAVEQDPTLIEDALNQRVIIASPTTLLGLLRVIEHAWRQKAVEANANEIRDLGAALYERICTMADHFQKLGDAITKSADQYNKTVGSLEKKVLPAARKMAAMGVNTKGEPLEEVPALETTLRPLTAKTWVSLPEPAGT